MVGLLDAHTQNTHPRTRKGLVGCVVSLLLMILPLAGQACTLDLPAGDNDAGLMIHITGHSFQGNYLIITYDIEYPGMTKVKLFNGNEELLWRSQYVDDKQGEHRLVLKASVLDPGNYVFEFDYKDQKQRYEISM
jgi:hypothetical protein